MELKEQAKEQAQAISEDNAIGQAGVSSSNFTSLMHNCISQTLVALKAEETVKLVIGQLENGEKPVIALSNTMGTVIKWYAEEHDVKQGDVMKLIYPLLIYSIVISIAPVTSSLKITMASRNGVHSQGKSWVQVDNKPLRMPGKLLVLATSLPFPLARSTTSNLGYRNKATALVKSQAVVRRCNTKMMALPL